LVTKSKLNIAINWYRTTSEENRKGIKVLASVLKHRGKKKFKKRAQNSISDYQTIEPHNMSLQDYRKHIVRNSYKSSYGDFFNSSNAKSSRESVLNYQKYSDMKCTSILVDEAKVCLNKWQELDDDEYYKKLIMSCLCSLLTFIKSSMPSESVHNRQSFQNINASQRIKVERYDKLIDRVRMSVKKGNRDLSFDRNSRTKPTTPLFRVSSEVAKRISTKVDPKKVKQIQLRGKGNFISLFQKNGKSKLTTYQNFFDGSGKREQVRNLRDQFTVSMGSGTMAPDPNTMRDSHGKIDGFKTQLNGFNLKNSQPGGLANLRSTRMCNNGHQTLNNFY